MSVESLEEFRKIYKAKSYIDNMRDGIDPVQQCPVPEDSVIRQNEVVECFSFLSSLLDRILLENNSMQADEIENQVQSEENITPEPFKLQKEQIEMVEITHRPITVLTFIKRINAVIDKRTTKPIRQKDIQGWMVSKGILQEKTVRVVKDVIKYIPAANTMNLGINATNEDGNSSYKINDIGQQFILENIDEIAEYAKNHR